MKKRSILVAACVTLMLATGCSAQERTTSSAVSTQMVSTSRTESTSDASYAENDMAAENESTITGIISDIKDFMFTITDENGVDYAISFEGEKPEGLSSVKEGDTVSVIYTGKLEETEAFTGTVISVTKK